MKGVKSRGIQKIIEAGNVLSMIESKGIRLMDGFRSGNYLELWRILRESQQVLRELHLSAV